MRKLNKILLPILTAAIVLLDGCGTPTEKKTKLDKAIQLKHEQLDTNRVAQVKQGAGMSDAGLHALRKNPTPTPYDDVAKMCLETSLLAFQAADVMPPSYELLRYRKMVEDLLSTNEVLKAQASNQLSAVQSQLAATEKREDSLLGDIKKLQDKLDVVNSENAAMATTWSRLKHIFWWIVWIATGLFILRVAATVIPPPYNSIGFIVDHVVGGVIRLLLAVFSHAKEAAKVVSSDANQLTEETLKQVVTSVQEFRAKNPTAKADLDALLLNETEQNSTRLKIMEVKKSLGYV